MARNSQFVRFKTPYASLSPQMVQLLTRKGVGRNGWPVMVALCTAINDDRVLGKKSARKIAELTGLSEKQVSRGMAELKELGIIAPIVKKSKDGRRYLDRSCHGHVATFCFSEDAWKSIREGFDLPEQ